MKLFVPDTKTEMVLKKPWTFKLFEEHRNFTLLKSLAIPYKEDWWNGRGEMRFYDTTLPAGTVLRVSRVYVRQGTADTFDSVTFHIKKCPTKLKGRFWVKLSDINNNLDVEIVPRAKDNEETA